MQHKPQARREGLCVPQAVRLLEDPARPFSLQNRTARNALDVQRVLAALAGAAAVVVKDTTLCRIEMWTAPDQEARPPAPEPPVHHIGAIERAGIGHAPHHRQGGERLEPIETRVEAPLAAVDGAGRTGCGASRFAPRPDLLVGRYFASHTLESAP